MKIFQSEYQKNYSTYTFSYAIYAVLEDGDQLSQAYEKGFLPYAGESEYKRDAVQEIYYLARSLRINLEHFKLSSENRRINKKAEPLDISYAIQAKEELVGDDAFNAFCHQYAAERFKGGHMDTARWDYVLRRSCGTHVFTFFANENGDKRLLGYVLVGVDDDSVHYWFSFFDTNYLDVFPIGKYMMCQVISWANDNEKKHVYLGTCYGPHSLYKVRDFKGCEFFDGTSWNKNIAELKIWCKSEDELSDRDRYKKDLL